jgi:hypothetical protein
MRECVRACAQADWAHPQPFFENNVRQWMEKEFGNVEDWQCRYKARSNGARKSWATVTFVSASDAKKATDRGLSVPRCGFSLATSSIHMPLPSLPATH